MNISFTAKQRAATSRWMVLSVPANNARPVAELQNAVKRKRDAKEADRKVL